MDAIKLGYLNFQTLKIGYYNYTLVFDPKQDELGTTSFDNKIITLNPLYPLPVIKETLFHEVLHAILEDSVLFSSQLQVEPNEREEAVIRFLSPRILHFYVDNPEAAAFLLSAN